MKIIITDYSTGKIYVFSFDENVYSQEDIIPFLDYVNEEHDLHLKESQCHWMIVEELSINIF